MVICLVVHIALSVYRIYMRKSPYTFPSPHIARGISVFTVLTAMTLSGVTASADAPGVQHPTPVAESATPLGAPAPLASPSSAYKFLQANPDGSPVAYDPCRPIHYVTNGELQPANGPRLVKEAIAAVSRATGLVFIDDGATDEAGGFTRKPFQPERYGNQWAPVLIAWVDPSEISGDAGQGASQTATAVSGDSTYVTGELDLSVLPAYGDDLERAVLQHELGHVVGLAHDDDGDELMNSVAVHQKYEYQPGDLAGLAILGQGKCLGF